MPAGDAEMQGAEVGSESNPIRPWLDEFGKPNAMWKSLVQRTMAFVISNPGMHTPDLTSISESHSRPPVLASQASLSIRYLNATTAEVMHPMMR